MESWEGILTISSHLGIENYIKVKNQLIFEKPIVNYTMFHNREIKEHKSPPQFPLQQYNLSFNRT